MGELVGSASVATRSEIKLRIMSAVSIAWYQSMRVRASKWCFVPMKEQSGCRVSTGTNTTKKQIPVRFKSDGAESGCSNPEWSQD